MDQQRKAVRMGAAVIVLAMILRLAGGGFFEAAGKLLQNRGVQTFFLYLQTGRLLRLPEAAPQTTEPQSSAATGPAEVLTFSETDLQSIQLAYGCDYRPELLPLLTQPLSWDLTGDGPRVLIVHTHATEAYTQTPDTQYEEDAAYRTLNNQYNMVSIGEEVARVLTQGGIQVLHDKTWHDYPSYNGSYDNARATIQEYLVQYPTIQLVLDIHRDASDAQDGSQLTTCAAVGGQKASQLMVVVGTDAAGNHHPDWQSNLALGLKLSAVLEREDPGVTRPVSLRASRFNMDLCPGSLLIEVGAAGDTHDQAILAANALARGILTLARGSV